MLPFSQLADTTYLEQHAASWLGSHASPNALLLLSGIAENTRLCPRGPISDINPLAKTNCQQQSKTPFRDCREKPRVTYSILSFAFSPAHTKQTAIVANVWTRQTYKSLVRKQLPLYRTPGFLFREITFCHMLIMSVYIFRKLINIAVALLK